MCIREGDEERSFFEVTWVQFKSYGKEVIEDYLQQVEVLDKAGSYAIQEHGELLVKRVEGAYDNVVGLPLARVAEQLESFGIRPERSGR